MANRTLQLITLLGILSLSTLSAQAPDSLWSKTFGGIQSEMFNSIDPLPGGGFILGGHTESNADTLRNYWLVRLNTAGDDTLWAKAFVNDTSAGGDGSEGRMAIATSEGGAVIVGTGDPRIIKTNSDGVLQWQLGETELDGGILGIEETGDGGFIACGYNDSGPAGGASIARITAAGAVTWEKSYGPAYQSYLMSITELSTGEFAAAGTHRTLEADNSGDGWLFILSVTGDSTASYFFGDPTANNNERLNIIRVTDDDGLILLGEQTLDGQSMTPFLIKTDGSGVEEWSETFTGLGISELFDVIQTSDLGFTLTGYGDLTLSEAFNMLVIHLATDGTTDWTLQMSGNDGAGLASTEISTGEYLVVGAVIPETDAPMDGWIVRLGTTTDPFKADSLALVALYDSLDGANWTNPWTLTDPVSTWDGVTIYNGRVTQLSFLNKNLSGSIPPSIVDLTAVWNLSFNGNPGLDSIPAFIGEMTNLYNLDLSFCALTTVPTELGNLENLEYLYLQNNSLTGAFPSWLADLSNLLTLRIDNNQFTGPIPTAVRTLANLTTFWINNNRFNFADIEPLVEAEWSVTLTYAPQADVGTPVDTTAYLGQPFSIEFTTPGTANTYQWQKNNVNITGEIDPVLSFTAIAYTDSGSYDVTIENTIAIALTLSSEDIFIHVVLPPIHFDSLALVALYNSTDGPNWTNNSGWLDPETVLADWYGVTVNDGRVTQIYLGDNNLSGTIPESIGELDALTYLNLRSNKINESIPANIGNLVNLTQLNLRRNELTGSIPQEIGNLVKLSYLSLNDNLLSGQIPAGIGNLINLSSLLLNNNQLSGSIPGDIGNLDTLTSLSLSGNQLSGQIPATIGRLTDLQFLSLDFNQLSDTITSEIGNLTELIQLRLERNQLSGSIPASVSNLTKMTYLLLGSNQLTGNIPPGIGNDTSLTILDLSNNQLTGPIPTELGNLVNLDALYLNMNQLSGTVPAELGNLTNCTYLYMQYNQLTGAIPPEIGGLTSVTNLELGHNLLTSVPAEIGKLSSLQTLALDFNRLADLPDFSPLTSLSLLQINDNMLTFGDIEPLMGLSIGYISYSGQDSVGSEIDTTVDMGTRLVMTVSTDGNSNHYSWWQWQQVNISYPRGTDSDILVIELVSLSDSGIYVCNITNTLADQLTLISRPVHVTVIGGLAVSENEGIPAEFALHANYPNPFNPSTTIRFDLPEAAEVHLMVYDILGREVRVLVNERLEPGYRQVTWNGRTAHGMDVPTGIYIARFITPEYTKSIKMLLLK